MKTKKERKKLKDTKIGIWLKDKAPDILNIIGDLLPDSGALGIVKNMIDKDDKIAPEVKLEAADIIEMTKLEIEEEKEITARWQADMNSDSWMSKNVRPIVLLYSWLLVTLVCVVRFFEIELPPSYVYLIETLCVSVNLAYFGSRGFEKIRAIKNQ